MILEIRDLSCRYVSRRKDTLSHVDLSLAEGEMVLIAGRSGCGKSTLIKSITGLLEPGEATREKGWILVCVDQYALGWGKLVNGVLKNKYWSGWRLKS